MSVVVTVVGARPQFVKAAVVAHAFAAHPHVEHRIVHTGQHFDANMSDVFFDELGIPPPAVNLHVQSGLHGQMTGRMLERLEALFVAEPPAMVIAYGDTNSTMAAALACAKLHVPIAHVEAGMRSFDRMPEEINRIVTDHLSGLHFTATDAATRNLLREGIGGAGVHQVGDVMYDCALRSAQLARQRSDIVGRLGLDGRDWILCTVHRAANTDSPAALAALARALALLAAQHDVVLPLHPRTRARLQSAGLTLQHPRLHLVEPLGYLDMTRLELDAALILTDSGGVQREAFFHGRPCVTLRGETEWTETVDTGWNVLVPLADGDEVARTALARIGTRGSDARPYGDGTAGAQIARILVDALDRTGSPLPAA